MLRALGGLGGSVGGVRTGIFSFWATMVGVVVGVVLELVVVVAGGGGVKEIFEVWRGVGRVRAAFLGGWGGNDIWVGSGKALEFAL